LQITNESKLENNEHVNANLKGAIANIMMHEGRITNIYWNELSKIFNKLYPEFNFISRKNKSNS
jgi:CRISPR-associated protein Cas1